MTIGGGAAGVATLRFGVGQAVGAEIGDADFHAEPGEADRGGKADAGRASGDDGNAVG